MAKVSPNLQHLTDGLPADKRAEVEEAITSSPYLRQIMTEAVNAGTLEHIRIGNPGANEGGHYDDRSRAIHLSADTFSDPILKNRPDKLLDVITSTLGHETGHALYAEKANKELYFTTGSITEGIRAAGPGGEFDATGLVGAYIRDARHNEAQAEIHGWNALASRIEYTKGTPPGRDEMLRRADATTDCVDPLKKNGYRLEAGIILEADMRMSDTRLPKAGPINLEPVAQCHFDNSRASLGVSGAANYTNYYGAYLVQQLADDTRQWINPPTIRLDMEKLGLDKAQLESTGLRLGNDGFSLVDTSQGKYRPMTLRSSGSGIQGTPDEQEPALAGPLPSASLMSDPAHSAHAMYLRAQSALGQVEAAPGMGGLTQHERQTLGASVVAETLSAEGWNFTRIDHAVPGKIDPQTGRPETLFLVQGALDDPAHRRIGVNMEQALSQSIEQSSTVSQTMLQTRDQAMALEQQRAEQKEQDGPQGPTMRIGPRTQSPSHGPQWDGGGSD